MKPVLLALVVGAALLAVPAPSSSPPPSSAAPINSITGDASYLLAFGHAPDARVPDDVRIATHLRWILGRLRAAPVAHLTASERTARARNLDRLARYVREGRFPRNPSTVHVRTPNFLDAEGRICAVGYLLSADLGAGAAAAIRDRFQFARIGAIAQASELLASWQRSSGLSVRELASIQPEYCPEGQPCYGGVRGDAGTSGMAVELATGTVGVGLAAANGMLIGRGKPSRTLAWLGIGAGVVSGFVAAREETEVPLFNASAGFVSAVVGLAALGRNRSLAPSPGPMSVLSLSSRPSPLGASALAVQWRF